MNQIIIRTYRFPLKTNRKQRELLNGALELCREIYNAGLQERRSAYHACGKSVTYFQQSAQIKSIRQEREDVASVPFALLRESLRRLDHSFQAFFRRCKLGEKPGFPRFKSVDRFNSLTFYCWTVAVNPNGTSQRCSQCGANVPKDLSVRVHDCPHCRLRLDRDHNAALNILLAGRASAGFTTAEVCSN